jgi:hypothetical protein
MGHAGRSMGHGVRGKEYADDLPERGEEVLQSGKGRSIGSVLWGTGLG